MANLSLIMRRNIMISRCVDLFVQIPKQSTQRLPFQKLLSARNPGRTKLTFRLVSYCENAAFVSFFFIGLDGDGPPIT